MLEFYPRQLWDPGAFLAVRMANEVSLEAADQGSWEIHTQELPKPGGDSSPVLHPQPYSLELTSVMVQTPPSTKEPGKEQTQGPLSHQGHRISAQSKPPGLLLLTPRNRRTKHLEFSRAPASFLPLPLSSLRLFPAPSSFHVPPPPHLPSPNLTSPLFFLLPRYFISTCHKSVPPQSSCHLCSGPLCVAVRSDWGRQADNHWLIECLRAIVECVRADPSPAT